MGVVEAVAIGVAAGVAMGVAVAGTIGVAGGVAMGAAVAGTIGVAGGVATGVVVGAAATGVAERVAGAGTASNSKSLTMIGIDGTGDSVACGCAKLGEIPKAVVTTRKTKIRMAQVKFPCRAGEKNMRGSLGRVGYQNTRGSGRKGRPGYWQAKKINPVWRPASRSGPATRCRIVQGGRGHPR